MNSDIYSYLYKNISQSGAMTLGEYISQVISHPQYGYYANNNPFGRKGDFITAPEISQIFGELIGAWIVDLWDQMGRPEFNLIECGAGRGTLMADILRISAPIDSFMRSVHLKFIESSPSLQKQQKEAIKPYGLVNKVEFYDCLSDKVGDRVSIIIGNEFLDILPIEQLFHTQEGWRQIIVDVDTSGDKKLIFRDKAASDDLLDFLPNNLIVNSCANSYEENKNHKKDFNKIYEVSPARISFIKDCSKIIKDKGGAALFIDYGYVEANHGNTLQAVKSHVFSDVLEHVGSSDITSHIDFAALCAALKEEARVKDGNAEIIHAPIVAKIVTQREFLLALGIRYRAQALKYAAQNTYKVSGNNAEDKAIDICKNIDMAVDRLIDHDKMGDLFKVFCFYSKECNANRLNPEGFA